VEIGLHDRGMNSIYWTEILVKCVGLLLVSVLAAVIRCCSIAPTTKRAYSEDETILEVYIAFFGSRLANYANDETNMCQNSGHPHQFPAWQE
jgi:hypothetical protein